MRNFKGPHGGSGRLEEVCVGVTSTSEILEATLDDDEIDCVYDVPVISGDDYDVIYQCWECGQPIDAEDFKRMLKKEADDE